MRVEEVIGDFVQLKRAGSNYKGLSPFSNERTPSFMVSPVKQIWKDFSSGKGGNAIAFLMEHEHFTYPEAIRYLAKKYHIDIEELLDQLGLTFTVIDYIETDTSFDFTVHYLSSYYYFPFTTEKDKKLIKM